MPPIQNVEEAIGAGEAFLSKYYVIKRPMDVQREGDTWTLIFNVGLFFQERVELKIDANSGSIIGYTSPENK